MKPIKLLLASSVIAFLTLAASAQSWTNGVISYYPFNGNANDVVGTNNGTVLNATLTADRFAIPNSTYFFNGSNSAVDLPPVTFNNLTSGTLSTWVELNRNTQEPIFCKQHDGDDCYGVLSVGFYRDGNGLPVSGVAGQVYFRNSRFQNQAASSTLLSTGLWYNVVATFSSTNCNLYINGVLSGSTLGNFSAPNDPSATTTSIGSWELDLNSGLFAGLAGKIDDFRIYNRALASNEVAQLYTSGEFPPGPRAATATAVIYNGFIVGINITDGGYGYTNTPLIRLIGNGGSGAGAVAMVGNGVVTNISISSPGSGYPTNATAVVIDPPYIFNPVLGIAPMSFLTFSNLTLGATYQLQQLASYYWTNLSTDFTSSNVIYTQMVAGVVSSGSYRLALTPVSTQAFAVPQTVNGFVVGATITSGGSGYVTSPAVSIVGIGGTNATAFSQISSGGVVTNISITSAGTGYTNATMIQIGQPPAVAISPTVLPLMRLDSASLAPYDNYQVQFKPVITSTWANVASELFTPTYVTNSQYIFITNSIGFFRLQYVP